MPLPTWTLPNAQRDAERHAEYARTWDPVFERCRAAGHNADMVYSIEDLCYAVKHDGDSLFIEDPQPMTVRRLLQRFHRRRR